MKYVVVSDIHGSSYYTKKLIDIINKEKPDKLILLGDLYYHGPRNILTKEYDTMKVSEILNQYKDIILCTRGNCDALIDEDISLFKFKKFIKININGVKFFFNHGDKYNMDNIPSNIDVLVYGHFHTGYIQNINNCLCVNPGSLSLPRNNTKHSYLVINDTSLLLKDIEGTIIEKANYKIGDSHNVKRRN